MICCWLVHGKLLTDFLAIILWKLQRLKFDCTTFASYWLINGLTTAFQFFDWHKYFSSKEQVIASFLSLSFPHFDTQSKYAINYKVVNISFLVRLNFIQDKQKYLWYVPFKRAITRWFWHNINMLFLGRKIYCYKFNNRVPFKNWQQKVQINLLSFLLPLTT